MKGTVESDQVQVVSEQSCMSLGVAQLSELPVAQVCLQLLQGVGDVVGEEGGIRDDVTLHHRGGRGAELRRSPLGRDIHTINGTTLSQTTGADLVWIQ